ncbi:hypothetical protein FGRMN_10960, partial [Fusarium graminum]
MNDLHENKNFQSYNDLALVFDDFSNATVYINHHFRTSSPRTLNMWDPPIDPMGLVNAVAAAGGNVQAALQGRTDDIAPSFGYQVVPRKRSTLLLAKAFELCAELKGSSSSLLTAIEKKDSEALQLLRYRQDLALQRIVSEMKIYQKSEAELGPEVLEQQRNSAIHRLEYYAALTGDGDTSLTPRTDEDFAAITQTLFRPVTEDLRLNDFEATEMTFANAAKECNSFAAIQDFIVALLFKIPMPPVNKQFMGL